MTKSKKSTLGQSIIKGLEEAIALGEGKKVAGTRTHKVKLLAPDVKAIRHKLGLSQDEFATRFGFSVSTLRNWEQGTRKPETTASVLLTVIDKAPGAVESALGHSLR